MENASKALIIAGAILLSILIISLGIIVVRNATSTINNANVNQAEIETFNSKFEAYVGSNRTASDVRALCSAVFSNNGAQESASDRHDLVIYSSASQGTDGKITGTKEVTMPTNISNSTRYTIMVEYGSGRYITAVGYKANTGTNSNNGQTNGGN